MKKRKLLFTMLALSLGCLSGGSGAMAQSTNNGWNALLEQTQTTSASWTALSAGSTTGMVLGAAQSGSNATYYYYITESLNFTNSNAGGSGLTIHGTVYLYIPNGLSITCEGANANGTTGAGAGIELASGNTLYIIGGAGTVTARGGNAANGGNGVNGGNADVSSSYSWSGDGGNGGNGGGGAGAGIGTKGGDGGNGGAGGAGYTFNLSSVKNQDGRAGGKGDDGQTALEMGELYVANGITVNASGGKQGSTGGTGGSAGSNYLWDGGENDSLAGGGGGGGGGFGGAASNIGTGGPGGGGGGGGAGGSTHYAWSDYYRVGAHGGNPGANGNGTFTTPAGYGGSTELTGDRKSNNDTSTLEDDGYEDNHDNRGAGGGSGDRGYAASVGTPNTGNLEYTITYHWLLPNVTTTTVKYSPSTGASVTLPQNTYDGYQWALGVYGKDCRATGDASEFTTASKEFYGGNIAATANRTIYLKDVYGNLDFYEVKSVCMLKNKGSNVQEIGDFFVADNNPNANAPKWPITVRLQDRTLYKDSHWNTICLPFGMTKDQVSASPLAGATIKKLNTSVSGYYPSGQVNKAPYQNFDYGHPVVLFWFDDVDLNSENLVAGKPYLVKWQYGSDLVDDTTEAENGGETPTHQLDFNYVTVKETEAGSWVGSGTSSGNANFVGTFSSTQLQGGNHKTLILGADDTLYYPSTDLSVAACRGFFTIPEEAANARQIVLGFGDGETTSIIATLNDKVEKVNDNVYNLNGQRLNVLQKGINIVNGKKVVIK